MEKEEGLFELGRGTEFIYLLSNHRLSKNLRDSLPPDDSYRERERSNNLWVANNVGFGKKYEK